MKPVAKLTCLAFSVLAIAGAQQSAPIYDGEATTSYDLPDGTRIRYEGTCSFDETHVSCWDRDGKTVQSIADRIQAFYLGQNTMNIAFRRKNRFVVFSKSGGNFGFNVQDAHGGYLPTQTSYGAMDSGMLAWANIAAEPDTKSVNIAVAPYGGITSPSLKVPFSIGSKADFQGTSIELGGAKPAPLAKDGTAMRDPNNPNGQPAKHWLYLVEYQTPHGNQPGFNLKLLDKSGAPILYVDRKGEPVSELTYVRETAESGPGFNGGFYNPQPPLNGKYLPVAIQESHRQGNVVEYLCNLNPDRVGSIEFSGNRQYQILFKDIPLDPK